MFDFSADCHSHQESNLNATLDEFYKESGQWVDELSQQEKEQRAKHKERNESDMKHYQRIGQVDAELVTLGGRTGGWDTRDHDVFLRVWTQLLHPSEVEDRLRATLEHNEELQSLCSSIMGNEALMRKMAHQLPGKSLDELHCHISVYLQHLRLTMEKKHLVQLWKNKRMLTNAEAVKVSEQLLEADDARNKRRASTPNSLFRAKKSADPRLSSQDDGAISLTEREQMRARIAQWKEEKQRKEEQQKVRYFDAASCPQRSHITKAIEEQRKREEEQLRLEKVRNA